MFQKYSPTSREYSFEKNVINYTSTETQQYYKETILNSEFYFFDIDHFNWFLLVKFGTVKLSHITIILERFEKMILEIIIDNLLMGFLENS